MEMNIDKHALRLSHLSVMQQQRALKTLAQKQRVYNKANKANAESSEANTYDWHRKVRLAREARGLNLMRAYLKGLPYKAVEQSLKPSTLKPIDVILFSKDSYYKTDFWVFWDDFRKWVSE